MFESCELTQASVSPDSALTRPEGIVRLLAVRTSWRVTASTFALLILAWLLALSGFALSEMRKGENGTLIDAVAIETKASAPLPVHSWLARVAFMKGVEIKHITYVSGGIPVPGYLVEPRTPGKYPAVIFNRGGYGEFGALAADPSLLPLVDLAADGYVVVASQYRGTAGAPGHDEFGGADVADVLNLIPLLESRSNIDASKIGMMGYSRGGMMTYIALAQSSRIKAAVIIGGAADLVNLLHDRPEMKTVFDRAIAGSPDAMTAELQRRSAVNWAGKLRKDVPLLIMHGTADWRVSPRQSLTMASLLLQRRVPFRLILFEGGDHGLTEYPIEARRQIHNWFRRYLKERAVPPVLDPHGN